MVVCCILAPRVCRSFAVLIGRPSFIPIVALEAEYTTAAEGE